MNNLTVVNLLGPVVSKCYIKKVLNLSIAAGLIFSSASAFALDTVISVPGKEYSDAPDIDSTPPPGDPGQVLNFDGLGGVTDGFDYSGTRPAGGNDTDVDAIANSGDFLFNQVTNEAANLLFSVVDDANIYRETAVTGAFATWATEPDINGTGSMSEIDGLEVWGPSDANRYSLDGDLELDASGARVSVWSHSAGTSTPLHMQASICAAIGLMPSMCGDVDVDAMMTSGRNLLFSVDAIFDSVTGALIYDGGEIWTWSGMGMASFLFHGGHVWDTAFDVKGTFGLNSENINALEAIRFDDVPIPAAAWLFASGLIGLIGIARRKSNA